MRRALIVLNCGLQIPSAMVRAMQYRPYFESSTRWNARYVDRKSPRVEKWLTRLGRRGFPLYRPLVFAPIKRLADQWNERREVQIAQLGRSFDLVYVIKIPSTAIYHRLREAGAGKIVMEMNDGLWLPAFKKCGWDSLDQILSLADAVICENPHVASYAKARNGSVHVVPDSPQFEVFEQMRPSVTRSPDKVVIGWIGSAENVGSLYRILEPLESLFAQHANLELRVVGAPDSMLPRFENVRFSTRPTYNQTEMVQEVLGFDIGIFPLFHNRDALARGNLKAMIYMSGGAATIAEDVGENPSLIRHGVNGMLASTPENWHRHLERLITHPEERRQIAQNGLESIRNQFRTPLVFERLINAFDSIVSP